MPARADPHRGGDFHRDDDQSDRFDVLREYWCAMLKAKALGMVY